VSAFAVGRLSLSSGGPTRALQGPVLVRDSVVDISRAAPRTALPGRPRWTRASGRPPREFEKARCRTQQRNRRPRVDAGTRRSDLVRRPGACRALVRAAPDHRVARTDMTRLPQNSTLSLTTVDRGGPGRSLTAWERKDRGLGSSRSSPPAHKPYDRSSFAEHDYVLELAQYPENHHPHRSSNTSPEARRSGRTRTRQSMCAPPLDLPSSFSDAVTGAQQARNRLSHASRPDGQGTGEVRLRRRS
jgi:hypothetical protein